MTSLPLYPLQTRMVEPVKIIGAPRFELGEPPPRQSAPTRGIPLFAGLSADVEIRGDVAGLAAATRLGRPLDAAGLGSFRPLGDSGPAPETPKNRGFRDGANRTRDLFTSPGGSR